MQGKVAASFDDQGEQSGEEHRRAGARVSACGAGDGGAMPHRPPRRREPTPALPDKPSIAVLPFSNMSGDPEQEYFADGITEDIITDAVALSRAARDRAQFDASPTRARRSTCRQVGRELGVRYVLEGSVRRTGNRVRITAQLIDAGHGPPPVGRALRPRACEDIFAVQDEITREIVAALDVRLLRGEQATGLAAPAAPARGAGCLLPGPGFPEPDHPRSQCAGRPQL